MYNPQLDTFLCVAECGSFNKAAEKLYISPPAVIKQINLLEEGPGSPAFCPYPPGADSSPRRARSLEKDARYIIEYCNASVTRAKECRCREDSEVIRIGNSPMTPAEAIVRSVA